MDYKVEQYNKWLKQCVSLTDAFSEQSMREMAFHVLMGQNYRLITESNTKNRLTLMYMWINDVISAAKAEYKDNWKSKLVEDLMNTRHRTSEQDDLMYWLVGLTHKTSRNIGVNKQDLPDVMEKLQAQIKELMVKIDRYKDMDKAWLLMIAGSATLTIRGSDKSKVGKVLEGVIIRTMLNILGLKENEDFWMNIDRDDEVERETDCEVRTKRGRIRIEVGLISSGNQEVVEDKINRVGRQGVILFDKVGKNTRIYATADNHNVKLVQIRGNQPLIEMYQHLKPLVDIDLIKPPELEEDIRAAVNKLPANIFTHNI